MTNNLSQRRKRSDS